MGDVAQVLTACKGGAVGFIGTFTTLQEHDFGL